MPCKKDNVPRSLEFLIRIRSVSLGESCKWLRSDGVFENHRRRRKDEELFVAYAVYDIFDPSCQSYRLPDVLETEDIVDAMLCNRK